MSDDPPPPSRIPLPPEDFQPATAFDYFLLIVSLLLATAMTLVVLAAMLRSQTRQEPTGWLITAMIWNALAWLVPTLRVLLNWRVGMLADIDDRSYLVRKFWQVQLLMTLIVVGVIGPFVILLWAACGPLL